MQWSEFGKITPELVFLQSENLFRGKNQRHESDFFNEGNFPLTRFKVFNLNFLSFHLALKNLISLSGCPVKNSFPREDLLYVELPFSDDNSSGSFFSFVAGVKPQLEPSPFFFLFFAAQFLPFPELWTETVLYTTLFSFSILILFPEYLFFYNFWNDFGNSWIDLSDSTFPNHPSRTSDRVGHEDCLRKHSTRGSKTRHFWPSMIGARTVRRLLGGKSRLKAERARFLS